jgi:hypothetical protein
MLFERDVRAGKALVSHCKSIELPFDALYSCHIYDILHKVRRWRPPLCLGCEGSSANRAVPFFLHPIEEAWGAENVVAGRGHTPAWRRGIPTHSA